MATKTNSTTSKKKSNTAGTNDSGDFDEASYKRLVELSPMPIAVHVKGKVVFANQAVASLMGVSDPEELIGENVMDYVHPDSRELVRQRIAEIYKNGKQHNDIAQEKLVRKDGQIIHVEISTLLFAYDNQKAIQLILRDISDQVQGQKALMEAKAAAEKERQRLYDLFMLAPACIALLHGPDHVFEFANPRYMDLVGPKRKVLGRPVREAIPEAVEQGFIELLDGVYKTGEPYIAREKVMTFNPVYKKATEHTEENFLDFVCQPSRDADGKVDGILVHAVDVTDQVKARHDVEYSNSLMLTITNNATLGLFMMDKNQHCTFMNDAAERITGYKLHEVEDEPLHNFIHHTKPDGSPYPFEECPIDRALPENNREQGEEIFVHRDGSLYPVRFTASPIINDGKPVGTVIEAQDLTEERKSQAALIESEERFRQLADSMPQMVWTATPEGEIDYRNKQWFKYTGFTIEKSIEAWESVLHPDDRDRCSAAWSNVVKTGGQYQIEYRLRSKDNPRKYRWFLARATLVRDASGKPVKWFGTSTDIDAIRRTTQRKQELEHLTAALREQRRELMTLNKAKDEFISLASHQLRTPATGVKQFIGMALEGYVGDLTPELRTFLSRAYDSNERQIAIINDLLKVAQVDAGKVQLTIGPTDLIALVKDVLEEHGAHFKARQQTAIFKPRLSELTVDADRDRLRMVLDNIIDNASKYTPHGKSIKVSVAENKHTVKVAVKDEGVGIEQQDLDKIFLKFSRIDNPLSAHVGGSGLGLYWVQKIIDLHGGSIEVSSTLGKGSTFTICLPAQSLKSSK